MAKECHLYIVHLFNRYLYMHSFASDSLIVTKSVLFLFSMNVINLRLIHRLASVQPAFATSNSMKKYRSFFRSNVAG